MASAMQYQIKLPSITEDDLAVGDSMTNIAEKLNQWLATYPQHDFKTGDVLIVETSDYSFLYERNYNMVWPLQVDPYTERLNLPDAIKVGSSTNLAPDHWKSVIPNLHQIHPDESILDSIWFEEANDDDTIAITSIKDETWVFVIDTPDSFVLCPSDFTDLVRGHHPDIIYTLDSTHRSPYDHTEKVVYVSVRNYILDKFNNFSLEGDFYPCSVY